MDWLLTVAWGAGLASLFLVADMIKRDIASRRQLRIFVTRRHHDR